ncbi:hypothetical protein ABPG75_002910 [Micractinium tetrahymenae]
MLLSHLEGAAASTAALQLSSLQVLLKVLLAGYLRATPVSDALPQALQLQRLVTTRTVRRSLEEAACTAALSEQLTELQPEAEAGSWLASAHSEAERHRGAAVQCLLALAPDNPFVHDLLAGLELARQQGSDLWVAALAYQVCF